MLGTAIIAAALATGDTMTQTIRSSAVSALGQTDELVSARGAREDYGVVFKNPNTLEVDAAATARLRMR